MASEQLVMWEAFDKSIEPELKKEWATLSTEPYKVNRRWTSVFLMSTSVGELFYNSPRTFSQITPEPSVTQTLLALNLADKALSGASQDYEGGFTGPSWILEGIEVEAQQLVICSSTDMRADMGFAEAICRRRFVALVISPHQSKHLIYSTNGIY